MTTTIPKCSSLPVLRARFMLVLGWWLLAGCRTASRPLVPTDGLLAVTHVTVIDVESGAHHAEQTILVHGNRIIRVGLATQVRVPTNATTVDGHGQFVIPGLWDMHVHTVTKEDYRSFFPLFVANGITGVREMWGDLALARDLRHQMVNGALFGPRLVVAGNLVDGSPPIWPGATEVATPDEGRAVVDSLFNAGAAFVKVYSRLPADAYFAIAARARELHFPFAGHVPFAVRAADAAAAGQRSMEHLYGVLEGCSSAEDATIEVMRAKAQARAMGDSSESDKEFRRRRFRGILDSQDHGRCQSLLELFRRDSTWQVPTLIQSYGSRFRTDRNLKADPRLRYLPKELVESWQPLPDRDWVVERAMHVRSAEIVHEMAKIGVPILAGSDTPNAYALPGFGLHDELQLLVRAGLSPLQALQAATLGPAHFFHATDSLGTVKTGKLADLVLLEADPLEDIRNTTRIAAVILNGRYLDRGSLDLLLASATLQVTKP